MKPLNRRNFLRLSTASTFGFQFLPSRAWGANERINVAGIGVGGKGAGDVASAAKAGANIVSLCDVDSSRAAKTINAFPQAELFTDFRVMLEKQRDIDAVIISAPDHVHGVAAKAAMELGKHIYCQKPLTHSIHEARILTESASKNKLITQMGNQAHAGEPIRRAVELVRAGIIGQVSEVHVWTNRPIWPQGMSTRPQREEIPNGLNWDLWLGPARKVPFSPKYVPFNWRGWWDFGTGALGDMACHIMDMPYWALDLKYPLSVVAEQSGNSQFSGPNWSTIQYQFPERRPMPPVSMTWYDGKKDGRPNWPDKEITGGEEFRGYESILVGNKGTMIFSRSRLNWKIVGRDQDEVKHIEETTPITIPRVEQDGIGVQTANHVEWVGGIKGQGIPLSNFAHSGPFTETVLLGNLAVRTGEKIEWDGPRMKANLKPANQLVRANYRKGWSM